MPPRWSTHPALTVRGVARRAGAHWCAAGSDGRADARAPVRRHDPALIRHLIGDETADLLLVPKSDLADHLGPPARVATWFFVHIFGQIERDLPRYQMTSRWPAPSGANWWHGIFAFERGGDRAPFAIPDHLGRTWDSWRDALQVCGPDKVQ